MTYSKLFSMLLGVALVFSVQHAEAKDQGKDKAPEPYKCEEGTLGNYSPFCPMSHPGFCAGMEKMLKRTKTHLHSESKLTKKTLKAYIKATDKLEKDWKTFFNKCLKKLADGTRQDAKDAVAGKGKK